MAKISAFKAIRQTKRVTGQVREDLKEILEPNSSSSDPLNLYLSRFQRLIQDKSLYEENEPAIYIYETSNGTNTQKGVWALTEINQETVNTIIEHEHIIVDHAEKIRQYKEGVGIEGQPIILTYSPQTNISTLIDLITYFQQPECYLEGNVFHHLWKVKNKFLIQTFEQAFEDITTLYVADGHHRLAASIGQQDNFPQLISTLYLSTDQLIIKEFNRLIVPEQQINQEELLESVNSLFDVLVSPNNLPYRPQCCHQIGMCLNGIWYQLNLKTDQHHLSHEADTILLQEYIFKAYFKINDPGQDKRLQNFDPVKGWPQLLGAIHDNPNSVAFTLFPITVSQFIDYANSGIFLPPKSTWIEPKLPYGLMMYHDDFIHSL